MDAINKFTGLRLPIFSTEGEKQEEQVPVPVTSSGIASTPDAFETIQASPLDLTPATTPMTTGNDGIATPGPQVETVEASSLFDLLTADATPAFPNSNLGDTSLYETREAPATIDAKVFDGSGEIRWDLMEALKTAMTRGDTEAVMRILQKIRPSELSPTLTEMARQGTPSELQLMVDQLLKNPTTADIMGSFLTRLVEKFSSDASVKVPLQQILSRMQGKPDADKIIRDLFERTRGQNILGKLDQAVLTQIYFILQSDKKLVNALCARALYEETGIEPEHCPGTDYVFYDPNALFEQQLNKNPYENFNDIGEAMRLFPQWGTGAINEAIKNGKLFDILAIASLNGPGTLGAVLAESCKQSNSENFLTEIFRELKKFGSDNSIRSMIQNLGPSAVQILSKYSPLLLMDIKNILENGDEKEINQSVLQNVIQPALNAAINREKWTQTGPGEKALPKIF